MRRALGVDERGAAIELGHPMATLLRARAAEGGADPGPLLAIEPLFGKLGREERFVAPLRRWLGSLHAVGTAATLEAAARELQFG
jgi:mannitol 2-dehydrogenase